MRLRLRWGKSQVLVQGDAAGRPRTHACTGKMPTNREGRRRIRRRPTRALEERPRFAKGEAASGDGPISRICRSFLGFPLCCLLTFPVSAPLSGGRFLLVLCARCLSCLCRSLCSHLSRRRRCLLRFRAPPGFPFFRALPSGIARLLLFPPSIPPGPLAWC